MYCPTNPRQHGYAFEMSEATFATCNEANKTGTGMRCAGAMPSTNLWGNTFTTQQIKQLQYIASLCPYTDGMAVYQARFLLAAFDTTIYENYCEWDINGNGQRLMPTEDEDKNTTSFTENVSIKVYPNPSNGMVHIESTTDITYVEIFNAIGGKVLDEMYDKRQIDIDAKNLPLGLYTIRIRTGDIIHNSKLIINK